MRVLVTGSSGFIGKHLIRDLRDRNFHVVEFDIGLNPQMDVTNKKYVLMFFSETEPDVIIHLAANANTFRSREDPYFDFTVNVLGTLNVLESILKNKKDTYLLFASSAYVYGEPQFVPITEDHPLNPTHPYGLSKLVAEHYIRMYNKLFGIPYTILRFFNIYGPGQSLGYVIPDLIHRAIKLLHKKGNEFLVQSSSEVVRDFVFIEDAIKAIIKAVEVGPLNTEINICSGIPTKIGELVSHILRILNTSNVKVKYLQDKAGKVSALFGSNKKAYELLGWRPLANIYDGLKMTIDDYLLRYHRDNNT